MLKFCPQIYPKYQARQILIALLNYFRTCRKEEEGRGTSANTCCKAIQYEKADRVNLWAETLPQTPKQDFGTAKRDFGTAKRDFGTAKQETKTHRQKCAEMSQSGHTGAGSASGEAGYTPTSWHNND